jgi:hypothetical protein
VIKLELIKSHYDGILISTMSIIELTITLPVSEYPIAGIFNVVDEEPEPDIVKPELELVLPDRSISTRANSLLVAVTPIKEFQSAKCKLIEAELEAVRVPPAIVLFDSEINTLIAESSDEVTVSPPKAFLDPLIWIIITEFYPPVIVTPAKTL